MTVVIELAPEIEQMAKAKAEARGISLEDYLLSLIAYAVQQHDWAEAASEQDAAWKYLENREYGTV